MTRRLFLRSMTTSATALGVAGVTGLAPAESQPDMPERVVLDPVPRIGFDTGDSISFPASLSSCLRYLDADAGLDYAYLLGTSGVAFGLLWEKSPWLYVSDLVDRALSQGEEGPVRRACESVGYRFRIIPHTDDPGQEAAMREAIVGSIRDARVPVLATGVVGPPACGMVTGYDEGGDVLIGWSFFQSFVDHGEADGYEPSGCYRKRDWYRDTFQVIVLQPMGAAPDPATVYRSAVGWAVDLIRTPELYGCHCGLAAYQAWARAVRTDADSPPDDLDVLLSRLDCHFGALMVVAEGRHRAAQFLRRVVDALPAMADDLHPAADLCDEVSGKAAKMAELQGGFDPHSAYVARKLGEAATRRDVAALIDEARDLEAQVADHLERALRT